MRPAPPACASRIGPSRPRRAPPPTLGSLRARNRGRRNKFLSRSSSVPSRRPASRRLRLRLRLRAECGRARLRGSSPRSPVHGASSRIAMHPPRVMRQRRRIRPLGRMTRRRSRAPHGSVLASLERRRRVAVGRATPPVSRLCSSRALAVGTGLAVPATPKARLGLSPRRPLIAHRSTPRRRRRAPALRPAPRAPVPAAADRMPAVAVATAEEGIARADYEFGFFP